LSVVLTFLDGTHTIGGTKIHLESGGRGLFLDFGINFNRMSLFYEEYLKPRSGRGIHDYLAMGLVPPIRVYREDLFPTDVDGAALRPLRVDGVLITHAHLDHFGCVGLLRRNIPVYCTAMTAAILKAVQDSGRSELHCQAVYSPPKRKNDRIVSSEQGKVLGRDFYVFNHIPEQFRGFWKEIHGRKELSQGRLENPDEMPLPVLQFPVDHSVFGASAYAIETDVGWVVYTGDLRRHGARGEDTKRFVREAAELRPKVLIIEGTRCGRSGEAEVSEKEVYRNSLMAVEHEKNLVVADFSSRNIERLETFMEVARKTGRELVITTKDAYILRAIESVDGRNRMRGLKIFFALKEKCDSWERNIEEEFREKLVDSAEISRYPEGYILCFSFWDIKNLLDIKPKGGLYIYSSSEAFKEEDTFDFYRLWNWLKMFKMDVAGFTLQLDGKPLFGGGFHASGHASSSDLVEMVETISPEIVVPVHTEHPEFFRENLKGPEVKILGDGDRLKIG